MRYVLNPIPLTDLGFVTYKPVKPEVNRIIFNDPATIVFWKDGTKTVVKVSDSESYSPYYGFLAALAKKIYGSNSAIQRIVRQFLPEEEQAPVREEVRVDRAEPKEIEKGDADGDEAVSATSFFDEMLNFLMSLTPEEENEE